MCLGYPKKAAQVLLTFYTVSGPRAVTRSPPFSDTIIIENLCQEVKILFLKPLGNLEMPLHRACRQALSPLPACSWRYLQTQRSQSDVCLALKEAVQTTASYSAINPT